MNTTEAASTSVLYIRCSDGRTSRPSNIRDLCVHQIRVPGGVLDVNYMELTFKPELPIGTHHQLLMHRIDTMVTLKSPSKIIIASHAHCGAAAACGFTDEQVLAIHETWGESIRQKYPDIAVEVLHEAHSECGFHREWYVPQQMAAQMS